MKKEQKTMMVSAFFNVLVASLKLIGGTFFNSYALIADGLYTISDFSTDILAMIGAKVGGKRANKKHPFGYGRFEYIMQIFIGIVILSVGIYIAYKSFLIKPTKSNLNILFIILLVILLKTLSANYLMQMGKKISSLMLINSAKESYLDVLSSGVIFIIVLVGRFLPVLDIIGSLFIAILIIISAIKIIIQNIILLIGEDDNNQEIKSNLKKIVNKYKNVQYSDSFLIRNGNFYQANLVIAVSDEITVRELLKLENKIKNDIHKERKLKIKYLDFDVIKD